MLQENTSAVVGVKAELGTPHPSQPSAGRLEFFVDWYVIHLHFLRVYIMLYVLLAVLLLLVLSSRVVEVRS